MGIFFSACSEKKELIIYYDASHKMIKEKFQVLKDNESIKHGAYKKFFENGKLQEQSIYNKGHKEGLTTMYFDNNMIKEEINFKQKLINKHEKVES